MRAAWWTNRTPRSVAAPEGRGRARALVVRRGEVLWDGVVRGTGLLAVVGIVILLAAPPAAAGLVGFLVVTIWVNGPIGMFLPATYEPILMLFGRLYPPVVVGLVGIVGTVYVEFLNYQLYARLLRADALRGVRCNPLVERLLPLFNRAPFFTVWLCAWSPLPYWTVRIMAPLAGYSVPRYLAATFLGRFPRLWLFAALGALPIPNRLLIPAVLIAVGLAFVLVFARPLLRQARGVLTRRRTDRRLPVPAPTEEVACCS
jgi:uncharacterized membrane protein YdjX (TVP38/TMEM64 family)